MSANQASDGAQPAVQRAEEMWEGLGHRLGRLVAGAGQGARSAAARARNAANNLERPGLSSPTGANAGQATERAEQMVDQWGQRLGELAAVAGLELRKAAEFAREDLEDIWAEARAIQHESQNKAGKSQR